MNRNRGCASGTGASAHLVIPPDKFTEDRNQRCAGKFYWVVRGGVIVLAVDLRRQAPGSTRLAEDCDEHHLAERLEVMSVDLLA